MQLEFEIGNVVTLRSGGPPMTITSEDRSVETVNMSVWCRWFSADNQVNSQKFPIAALVKADT